MDAQTWSELPLVEILDRKALEPHLSVAVGRDVEMRRCPCGALIASFGRGQQHNGSLREPV